MISSLKSVTWSFSSSFLNALWCLWPSLCNDWWPLTFCLWRRRPLWDYVGCLARVLIHYCTDNENVLLKHNMAYFSLLGILFEFIKSFCRCASLTSLRYSWVVLENLLIGSRCFQICPAQAITIEAEEREDGSRRTTRWCLLSPHSCVSVSDFFQLPLTLINHVVTQIRYWHDQMHLLRILPRSMPSWCHCRRPQLRVLYWNSRGSQHSALTRPISSYLTSGCLRFSS